MITPYKDSAESKVDQVRRMFNRIAPQYDRLNLVISLGLDRSWRRKALSFLAPYAPKHVLDVATGTGDVAISLVQTMPSVKKVTGVDISEEMMRIGAEKVHQLGLSDRIVFDRQDCTATSFEENTFDAATISSVSATSPTSLRRHVSCIASSAPRVCWSSPSSPSRQIPSCARPTSSMQGISSRSSGASSPMTRMPTRTSRSPSLRCPSVRRWSLSCRSRLQRGLLP